MKVDHHSYIRNFCSYEKKALKISSCEKVASITAMISAIINSHIILHAAVHIYDFHPYFYISLWLKVYVISLNLIAFIIV